MRREISTVSGAAVRLNRPANCMPAQDAQGVLGKRGAGVAQHTVPQIRRAAEKIQRLPRARIVHDGVDGEIAAARRRLRREGRIKVHFESLVAGRHFGILARHGEIVAQSPPVFSFTTPKERPTKSVRPQRDSARTSCS